MKITSNSQIDSSTSETLKIEIEFDPANPQEEGYAALIATLVDTIRHTLALERTIDILEESGD